MVKAKTFGNYLKDNCTKIEESSEFKLVIKKIKDNEIHFYIHPLGRNGQTMEMITVENMMFPQTIAGSPTKNQ